MRLGILARTALIVFGGTLAQTTEFPGVDRLADGLSLALAVVLVVYATLNAGGLLLAGIVSTRHALR